MTDEEKIARKRLAESRRITASLEQTTEKLLKKSKKRLKEELDGRIL